MNMSRPIPIVDSSENNEYHKYDCLYGKQYFLVSDDIVF